ncbi:hypothetical protein D3C75_809050 [compost metagenome]
MSGGEPVDGIQASQLPPQTNQPLFQFRRWNTAAHPLRQQAQLQLLQNQQHLVFAGAGSRGLGKHPQPQLFMLLACLKDAPDAFTEITGMFMKIVAVEKVRKKLEQPLRIGLLM